MFSKHMAYTPLLPAVVDIKLCVCVHVVMQFNMFSTLHVYVCMYP